MLHTSLAAAIEYALRWRGRDNEWTELQITARPRDR